MDLVAKLQKKVQQNCKYNKAEKSKYFQYFSFIWNYFYLACSKSWKDLVSVKQTLLVGFREQLSNFDDFDIDSTSPLYARIQEFVESIITKQIKQEQKMDEDFPSLDNGRGKKNIVDKIKQ